REQRRVDARQRAAARETVGDRLDAEAAEALGAVARHQDLRKEVMEEPDRPHRDRLAAHRGERLVASPHAPGASPRGAHPRPRRGPDGLWAKHGEPPMDGYQRFLKAPRRAWEERLNPAGPMRELWEALAAARPNPGHTALAELEALGVLKCTITQNVDNLHRAAGSERLLEIHGNATLIRCIECIARYPRESIDFAELPPRAARSGGGDAAATGRAAAGAAVGGAGYRVLKPLSASTRPRASKLTVRPSS